MLRHRPRFASTLGALISTLALALVVGSGVAPAANATDSATTGGGGGYSPIGYWTGTVSTANGSSEPVRMLFGFNDTFVVFTESGSFTGTWRSTGRKTFTYAFVRTLPGPDGSVIGSIDIQHSATFKNWWSFTSTGTATGYDLDGNVLFTAPVSVEATRF